MWLMSKGYGVVQARDSGFLWGFLPAKQAITGNNYGGYDDDLPALQVEQVKKGRFGAIYEDNAWLFKPNSNHLN